MNWKPYTGDRLIREHPAGFVVIVPKDHIPAIPLCCELCSFVFRSRDDEFAYREFSCCHLCAMTWAHSRRQAWKDGWRPTKEQVTTAVQERPPLNVTFDVD